MEKIYGGKRSVGIYSLRKKKTQDDTKKKDETKKKKKEEKKKSQSFYADDACMSVCVSVYVCLFVCDYYRYVHLYGDQCDWPVIEPGKRAR